MLKLGGVGALLVHQGRVIFYHAGSYKAVELSID